MDLARVVRMPLQAISVTQTTLTDADCECLPEMSKTLMYIDLQGTKITDGAIEVLSRLEGLRHLGIAGTGISDEGVKKLATALPNCQISTTATDE